ncbi:MAG: metallophosphoesterase [Clostridia bacterium]|nr:metallophosphoesterase [Clostridia bacterium]
MTYVMSDIHGEYKAFLKMLEEIKFSDNDVLYIAGDFVDYGEEPMALLCDVSMRANVIPVAGEHDLLALRMLTELDRLEKSGTMEAASDEMKQWLSGSGRSTLVGFHTLDEDMKEGILDYLSDMVLFEEVKVKGEEYLIVHAGLKDYDGKTPLEELDADAFLGESLDPQREYFEDKTVIVGHIHTSELPDADENMIYYGEGSIYLDCGAARGGRLGCLCLDNGKEYYVS